MTLTKEKFRVAPQETASVIPDNSVKMNRFQTWVGNQPSWVGQVLCVGVIAGPLAILLALLKILVH